MVRQAFPELYLKYSQNFDRKSIWSCNMSYKRKFCGLSEYVRLQNVRPIIKSTALFKQGLVDLVYAELKTIIEFRGFLRTVWPQKSHISSFSF